MRVQRAWVATLLVLLVVPGVIGFDLWPLTGWRLFSLSRDAVQTEWALDVDGREVDLEELPLAFRNAAWPLAELPRAGEARQQEVCEALLTGVRARAPEARSLELVREERTMTVEGIIEDREVLHRCS